MTVETFALTMLAGKKFATLALVGTQKSELILSNTDPAGYAPFSLRTLNPSIKIKKITKRLDRSLYE